MDWMFVAFPPSTNLHIETLTPKVMVLEDGAFGKKLDLDEILRVEPPWLD